MKNIVEWKMLSGINESKDSDFSNFSKKRYQGAKKIANAAKEKGGPALLTYSHFVVKLPYYEKASSNEFDSDEMKKEYQELCNKLHSKMKNIYKFDQKEFQELLGKLEAIGELLIKMQSLS